MDFELDEKFKTHLEVERTQNMLEIMVERIMQDVYEYKHIHGHLPEVKIQKNDITNKIEIELR